MNRLAHISASAVAALLLAPAAARPQTGTIAGTVRVDGVVPPARLLEVTKNQEFCGESVRAREVIVNDGKLAFAIAFVEGLEGEPVPEEYMLSNSGCSFEPPVLAVTIGSTLIVTNEDDVLHNTHLNLERGTRTRTVGNWALSRKGVEIRAERPLRRAGLISVECDAHPWMHARIMVFDHPYVAVTSESGSFEIAGVPAGTHTLTVWHEVFGELKESVTVDEGGTTSVSFSFSADAIGAGQGGNP